MADECEALWLGGYGHYNEKQKQEGVRDWEQKCDHYIMWTESAVAIIVQEIKKARQKMHAMSAVNKMPMLW